MDVHILYRVFMWCSIINGGLLIFSFLVCALGGNFVYAMHARWFPMSRETHTALIYGALGIYKILVIAFNVVPFIALSIIL